MNLDNQSKPISAPNDSIESKLSEPDSLRSVEPEGPTKSVVDERVRLMGDGILNNTSRILIGVIGIVLVPVLLKGLGADSYGIWIAALSVTGTVAFIDFGLGMSVTREAATSLSAEGTTKAAPFIKAAWTLCLLIGVIGGIVIATLGLLLSRGLHLSAASRPVAAAVFALAGVCFLADRLLAFTMAVLTGLRRFDLTNSLVTLSAVARAIGIIALVKTGCGVVTVMMWQVVLTSVAAVAGQWMVRQVRPEFGFQLVRFDWDLVRSRLAFGLASQLTAIVEIVIWDLAPVVVGLVLGSKWIVTYYIAQQFPTSLGPIIWSTGEALFPAAAQHGQDREMDHTREILEVGTRWIVVLALPLCMGLWIVAPKLLQAWVETVPDGAVLTLRLITLAVFMDGFSAASIQVLWGRNAIRTLVIIPCLLMVSSLGFALLLLPRIGIAGAAWGLVVPMCIASLSYMYIGARTCGVRTWHLVRTTYASLVVPVMVFLAICLGLDRITGPGWPGVIAATVGGGAGYLISLLLVGAREEELMLVRKGIEIPRSAGSGLYRRLRHALARVGFLRSGYFLVRSIREAMQDSPASGQAELDEDFAPHEDPWDYATVSYQQDRIHREVEMLDAVRGTARFSKALEVGCAEGLFTEVLAPRCEYLLAADISSVALARARRRLQKHEQVQFAQWDLRIAPIPESYDLIVIIHALEYIGNPLYVRRARTKLVNSLRPGGYLLVGTMKVAEIFEDAWWGKYFLRSGKRINNFFAEHPEMKVVSTEEFYLGKDYVAYDVLLQKKS
jgi:O-antigen/teichoic acid export membrane protein/SAM-dependent methyltransferase